MSHYSNHIAPSITDDSESYVGEFTKHDEADYAEYLAFQALRNLPADARQRVIAQAAELDKANEDTVLENDPPF